MKILVTGGAGCIGSELAQRLLLQGHSVTAIDDLSSGKLEHIEPLLADPTTRARRAAAAATVAARQRHVLDAVLDRLAPWLDRLEPDAALSA